MSLQGSRQTTVDLARYDIFEWLRSRRSRTRDDAGSDSARTAAPDNHTRVAAVRLHPAAQLIFANPAALLHLAGAVLVEQHDGRQVSERRHPSEGSMTAFTAVAARSTA